MGYVVGGGMNLGQVNIFLDKKQQQNVATCKCTCRLCYYYKSKFHYTLSADRASGFVLSHTGVKVVNDYYHFTSCSICEGLFLVSGS